MNCRESLTLDLAEFLTRASAPEFAAFRAHYPRCADCSAEVRAWTELYTALSASAHPSPETLLRYPAVRRALEKLSGKISADDMRALNHAADVEHRDISTIAREFIEARITRESRTSR